MIYVSCYGVFQPWLLVIFMINVRCRCLPSHLRAETVYLQNLFEVCIDAAKVNSSLRSCSRQYIFYVSFWVGTPRFMTTRSGATCDLRASDL